MLTRLRAALLALLSLMAAPALAQQFPATLPANTVFGRLGISPGPGQAIPFSILTTALLQNATACTSMASRFVGDGTTDNSAAMTALFSEFASGATQCAQFPPGTYLLNSCGFAATLMAGKSITMIGAGPTQTEFTTPCNTGTDLFSFTYPVSSGEFASASARLENFAATTSKANTGGYAIKINGNAQAGQDVQNTVINNITVRPKTSAVATAYFAGGIQLVDVRNAYVSDFHMYSCNNSGTPCLTGVGFNLHGSSTRIPGSVFLTRAEIVYVNIGVLVDGQHIEGFEINGASQLSFLNYGFLSNTTNQSADCSINGGQISFYVTAITVTNCAESKITGTLMLGVTGAVGPTVIAGVNTDRTTFVGNVIGCAASNNGLVLDTGALYWTVTGNSAAGCGTSYTANSGANYNKVINNSSITSSSFDVVDNGTGNLFNCNSRGNAAGTGNVGICSGQVQTNPTFINGININNGSDTFNLGVANGEFAFVNNKASQNTLAIFNQSTTGISAINFIGTVDNGEHGAIGWDNNASTLTGRTLFIEASNLDTVSAPAAFQIVQTGVWNATFAQYLRAKFGTDGSYNFYNPAPTTATPNPAFQVAPPLLNGATGLQIATQVAGSGIVLGVISTGTNENLFINPKGNGAIQIGNAGGGNISLNSSLIIPAVDNTASFGNSSFRWLNAYATTLNLGKAGATVGSVVFANATSGTVTVNPATGALGTVTDVLGTNSGTFVVSASSPLVVNAATGNIACTTCLTGNQTITLSGDVTGSGTTAITTTLATVNSNVGTFGSATNAVQVTVNAKGLITAISNVAITVSPSELSLTNTHILVGNASNVGADVAMSGDATLANTGALTLASVVTAGGPTGSATVTPIITYDAKGRLTAVSSATITPAIGNVTGLGTGCATWLATPSSSNLATCITDETGTGPAVFATNPTLATPTFTTNFTSPLHIGGSGTTGTQLTFQSTTGVGTTDQFAWQGGNNGATNFALLSAALFTVPSTVTIGGAKIGTNTLTVWNSSSATFQAISTTALGSGSGAGLIGSANATPTGADQRTGFLLFGSTDGTTNTNAAGLASFSAQAWTIGTAQGAYLDIQSTPTGTAARVTAVRVQASGGVYIGPVASVADPGIGGLQLNAQMFMPNITTSSSAQTGTVCWTTGTGKFTVDTTTTCLLSIGAAKNIISRPTPMDALGIVAQLEPVSFRYKDGFGDSGKYEQFGLIAEQVASVDERLAGRDTIGNLSGVRYQELTAVLVGAIQKIKADNDNFEARLTRLEAASK